MTSIPDGHETEKKLEFWADQTELEALDGAMFSVWLHGKWRWLTRNMTSDEKEAAANAVYRHHVALTDHTEDDAGGLDPLALRWWR
jgi:hypothetical protein